MDTQLNIENRLSLLITQENLLEKQYREEGIEYRRKEFEILEGEIREIDPEEGTKIMEDPLSFPDAVQRKYFGRSADEWTFPESVDQEAEIPDGFTIISRSYTNPYTQETREILSYEAIPRPDRGTVLKSLMTDSDFYDACGYSFSDIEIGDIITARVFEGNPYAQMVLQAKATEAMFRKMAGHGTPEDDAVLEKKTQVMTAVNQIRALFSLSPM